MNDFHIIKLVNSNMGKGFVINETQFVSEFTPSVKHFESYFLAHQFIHDNNLTRNGTRAYILDKKMLMNELQASGHVLALPANTQLYYVENKLGLKLFQYISPDDYFFSNNPIGFCVWTDENECKADMAKTQIDEEYFIKPLAKAPKQ